MKHLKIFAVLAIMIACVCIVIKNDGAHWTSAIAGGVFGYILPLLQTACTDLLDNTNWKISETKLKRGKFIRKDTMIRVSFAYLFRIKHGDKYFLVKNARGTGKYQPVGGVYKATDAEAAILKNRFNAVDDNKIPLDESSRRDYRMRIADKYLRAFVRRFDSRKSTREQIHDLSRELREELIVPGFVDWKCISYRYCGRHIAELAYSKHFQCYELLLADVVELQLTEEQQQDLVRLSEQPSDVYCFATAEDIKALGVRPGTVQLSESIGDHTQKTLQENEQNLMRIKGYGKVYKVHL